jgi:hypothetical protein
MQRFLIVLVQLVLLTSFANAQSSVAVVKEFGLFGIWALDCSRPASPANAYVGFSLTTEGTVELRDSFEPDYDEMVYRVIDARRIGAFRLAMRQMLTADDRIVLETETLRTRDRIRNWLSRWRAGKHHRQERVPDEQGGCCRRDQRDAGRHRSQGIDNSGSLRALDRVEVR